MTFSALYTRRMENLLRFIHHRQRKARHSFFFIPLSSVREILRRRLAGKLLLRLHTSSPSWLAAERAKRGREGRSVFSYRPGCHPDRREDYTLRALT